MPIRRMALVGLGVFLLWPLSGRAEPNVHIGQAPGSWVDMAPLPPPPEDSERDLQALLLDEQLSFDAQTYTQFVRSVYRVATVSGVQEGSTLHLARAEDEEVTIHHVRIHRGGEVVEALTEPEQIRVLHDADRVGQGLLDDRRTLLLPLSDVRVGDVIEYAYSRTRPRHHAGGPVGLEQTLLPGPAARMRWSARWTHDVGMRSRLVEVPSEWVTHSEPGRLQIDVRELPEPPVTHDRPRWAPRGPGVELSPFADWASVADWAVPLYEGAARDADLSAVPLEAIRAPDSQAERILRAIRYVQDDVRYFGIEIGEGRFVPRPPSVVAERRYGDCKDKSLLLVAILRALEIEAAPVLVHSTHGELLPEHLPSPAAFDHVIVRFELDGEVHWVDATESQAGGDLQAMTPPDLRWGLVLIDGQSQLEAITQPVVAHPMLEVIERFDLSSNPARLSVETIYRGTDAALYRRLAGIRGSTVENYANRGLEIVPVGDPTVEDDERGNVIRRQESFTVRDFWGSGRARDVSPWGLGGTLPRLPLEDRAPGPVRVPHPSYFSHRVSVRDPNGWTTRSSSQTYRAGPVTLRREVEVDGDTLTVTVSVVTSADHVEATEVASYAAALRVLRQQLGYEVYQHGHGPADAERLPTGSTLMVCVGVVLFGFFSLAGVRWARKRWRGRRARAFQKKQRSRKGETPATAIAVESQSAAEARVGNPRCCGSAVTPVWTSGRFDGDRLLICTWTCEACGTRTRRFHRLTATSGDP